jgi:hypothetical protein
MPYIGIKLSNYQNKWYVDMLPALLWVVFKYFLGMISSLETTTVF